jgi:hypothetical protein
VASGTEISQTVNETHHHYVQPTCESRRSDKIYERQVNLVQAQANRYADTAALFQALGGGWWSRADFPKN